MVNYKKAMEAYIEKEIVVLKNLFQKVQELVRIVEIHIKIEK